MDLRSIILIALLATPAASAVDARHPAEYQAIEEYVRERLDAMRVPGAALVIVDDGHVSFAQGFGEADPSGRSVTADTPFFLASVTKTFTATLVLQLVEEGQLELDAPVRRYLPQFAVATPGASETITLRHLLSHTSGLPAVTPGEYDRVLRQPPTPMDVQREIEHLRDVELIAAPGERFQYSNVGFTVLAGVLEAVTQRPYEEVLQERIFTPLQMTRSFTLKEDARAAGLATGYRQVLAHPVPFDWSYSRAGTGGGFTMGSANDLARFAIAILDARTLTLESVELMQQPVARPLPGDPAASRYGLGWFVGTLNDERIVYHSGEAPNFHADIILLPDRDGAVILLTNTNDAVRQGAHATLAHAVAAKLVGASLPSAERGSSLALVRDVSLGGTLLLALVAVATLRAARRSTSAAARVAWATVPALALGGAWAYVNLALVPMLLRWPFVHLQFMAPEVGAALIASGVAALVWVVVAGAMALRQPQRRARAYGL